MKLSDIKAKRSLGQNFLVNPGVLERIVEAAEIGPDDMVIEVGPGTGVLTKKLAEKALQQDSGRAGRVIAIEKDRRLIEGLKNEFRDTNVEIIEGDVLKLDIDELFRNLKLEFRISNYKVVGNIPYYITSKFLRTVFEKWPSPKLIVLTTQKEVARRIMAKPGDMNLLALSVQLYSDPEIIMDVSRNSFRPVPKVDSTVIKLTPNLKADRETIEKVLKLARRTFTGRRKQLKNTLPELEFKFLDIDPQSRPEELSINNWLRVGDSIKIIS